MMSLKDMFKRRMVMASMFATAMISGASAAVDFSAITDLVNATISILGALVDNSTTLISFVVLMFTLSLISGVIFVFIKKLLSRVGEFGSKGKE